MRYALVLTAAALFAPTTFAADPPITFQTHPLDRTLDELRAAADLVGGEKAVKAVNKSIKDTFGDKGFDGLDISRPVVGYVILAPKPQDITAVFAFPITGEKEFLALCDRTNPEKHVDLGKGLYHLPPLDRRYKARLRFSDGYAYMAYGFNPEPALDPKALVPTGKLYDPGEKGIVAAKFHFDRITPEVKLAIPALWKEVKATLFDFPGTGAQERLILNPLEEAIDKIARRYVLLIGGADTLAVRANIDVPNSDVVVEATLTPKPGSELAKEIAARVPTGNRFPGLLTPDTAVGFKTRLPFFNEELKAAGVKALEEGQRQLGNGGGPEFKPTVDELFKGLIRTVKTGEVDIAAGVRGPDKDGEFTFVGAVAFEDPAALEKEFRAMVEKQAPPDEAKKIKWDADKAGTVNIHTYQIPNERGFFNPAKVLGGDKCTLAFAFAPKGVFVVIGPDAVAVIKGALVVKPGESPVMEVLVNPARTGKLAGKVDPADGVRLERALGKEDKLVSASSLRVTGGKELTVRFAQNLRMIGRIAADEFDAPAADPIPGEKK